MSRVLGGAVLVVAGIVAFIEASSHHPIAGLSASVRCPEANCHSASGLSQTAYDLLRIGGWALVMIGVLVVVMGLIRYWRMQGPRQTSGFEPPERVG